MLLWMLLRSNVGSFSIELGMVSLEMCDASDCDALKEVDVGVDGKWSFNIGCSNS